MKWLLFIKVNKNIITVILTTIDLDKLDITKYNLHNYNFKYDMIESNILNKINSKLTIKDKLYLVSDKTNLEHYKFIRNYMKKLYKCIVDNIDYNTLNIIFDNKSNDIIQKNLEDETDMIHI
jgi:hypothetical protein